MSDNRKTVAGYLLPTSITAEQIRNACAANGYSMMFVATSDNPERMLKNIIMTLGRPVSKADEVKTAVHVRVLDDGDLDWSMIDSSVLPDGQWVDVVRRTDMDDMRAAYMAEINDLRDTNRTAMHALKLVDELFRIGILNSQPDFIDRVHAVRKTALRAGGGS